VSTDPLPPSIGERDYWTIMLLLWVETSKILEYQQVTVSVLLVRI
jgi:hypothetical protein